MHPIISNAKTLIQVTYHGLDRKNLRAFVHEFCYRYNIRNYYGKKFKQLLHTCLMGKPTPYRKILGYKKPVLNITRITSQESGLYGRWLSYRYSHNFNDTKNLHITRLKPGFYTGKSL